MRKLLAMNALGFIPGPKETSSTFQDRVDRTTAQREAAPQRPEHADAMETVASLYDIQPTWVPVIYSDKELRWWHGGCTWFLEENGLTTRTYIQLPARLESCNKLFGLYHRDEILAHELVHVGRMAFPDSFYEEILAYETSRSAFRRRLGPLGTWGISFCLSTLTVPIVVGALLQTWNIHYLLAGAAIASLPILFSTGYRILWKRAMGRLSSVYHIDASKARAASYRMTGKEVLTVAISRKDKLERKIKNWSNGEIRWKVLVATYLSEH